MTRRRGDRVEPGLYLGVVAVIAADRDTASPGPLNEGHRLVQSDGGARSSRGWTGHHDARAGLSWSGRAAAPDPATGTGDHGDLPCQRLRPNTARPSSLAKIVRDQTRTSHDGASGSTSRRSRCA